MELMDIQLFQCVVERGSVTRAGEELAMSQPTVSRRIRKLEQEMGTTLLDRTSFPVTPTAKGLAFLEFANAVMESYQALRAHLDRPEELSGVVRIATSTAPAARVVKEWVAGFVGAYPGIHVKINRGDSRDVEEMVSRGAAAVGFVGRVPDNRDLACVPVSPDEIVLVVPATSDYAHIPDEIEATVLATLPIVQREAGSATLRTVLSRLREHGYPASLSVVLEVDSHQTLIEAVEAGIGAGFVSRHLLDQAPSDAVRVVRVQGIDFSRTLYVVYDPPVVRREPAVSAFLRYMTQPAQPSPRRGAPGARL